METNRLKQFKTLVETQHLRKAAELLRMSNGGLSKSIKALEQEIGKKLLIQSGRNIEITEDGQALYSRLPDFFASLEGLYQGGQLNVPQREVIRLGTFEVFSTYFMGPVVRQFLDKNISLKLFELIPGELEEAIQTKAVDLGITYIPISRKGIEFYAVTDLSMGIFHLQGAFQSVPVEELPFVIPNAPIKGSPSSPTHTTGLDAWPTSLFPRKIAYEVDLMETALEFARAGVAAAYLPEFIVNLHNAQIDKKFRLIKRPVAISKKLRLRPIYIIRRANRVEDAVEKQIAKAIRLICKI